MRLTTGKTHLMKLADASCDITKTQLDFAEKLIRIFLPSGRALGRLVKRQKASSRCAAELITRTDDLKRKLPYEGPSTGEWKKRIVAGCAVFNIATWNKNLSSYPVERVRYYPD